MSGIGKSFELSVAKVKSKLRATAAMMASVIPIVLPLRAHSYFRLPALQAIS